MNGSKSLVAGPQSRITETLARCFICTRAFTKCVVPMCTLDTFNDSKNVEIKHT